MFKSLSLYKLTNSALLLSLLTSISTLKSYGSEIIVGTITADQLRQAYKEKVPLTIKIIPLNGQPISLKIIDFSDSGEVTGQDSLIVRNLIKNSSDNYYFFRSCPPPLIPDPINPGQFIFVPGAPGGGTLSVNFEEIKSDFSSILPSLEEENSSISSLPLTNVDSGQATFPSGSTMGSYGIFSIDSTGHGTYTLNNTAPTVQALNNEELLSKNLEEEIVSPTAVKNSQLAFKIIKEYPIFEQSESQFLIEYNPDLKLWFGLEQVTHENINWWRSYLGAQVSMLFGKSIKRHQEWYKNVCQEWDQEENRLTDADSIDPYLNASLSCKPSLHNFVKVGQQLLQYGNPYNYSADFQSLRDIYGPDEFLDLDELTIRNYLDAWQAFDNNLSTESPVYIAFASSQAFKRRIWSHVPSYTSAIKIAMTVAISEHFYTPVGIHRNSVAQAADRKNKVQGRPLAMTLQSMTAQLISRLYPEIRYMILRPLPSMTKVLKDNHIKFCESNGTHQETELPYLRCTKEEKLTVEESSYFGGNPYAIIDPQMQESYQISGDHWFAHHPYLGGGAKNDFNYYPFIVTNITTLSTFSPIHSND